MLNILKNKIMTDETRFLDRIDQKLKERLDEKFNSHNNTMNEKWLRNEECHERVIEQVIRTNGRVSKLEKWRWGLGGAITLLGVLFSVFGLFIINKLI